MRGLLYPPLLNRHCSMSRSNFDTYQSTNEVFSGFSSLYHDGTAITLGSEPIMFPDMSYAGSWTIEFWVKSSTITDMCLLSIADGASTSRYFDVYISGGDKLVCFYEGVETTHTFTATTDYVHMGVGYNTGTNTLYIATASTTTTKTFAADMTIANTEGIHLFRPIHEDAGYFEGYIGNLRIRNNSSNYSGATYTATTGQGLGWSESSTYPIAGVRELLLQTTNEFSTATTTKQHHSFCYYSDTQGLACSADTWGGNITKRVKIMSTPNSASTQSWGLIAARGMHYYPITKTLLAVDGDNSSITSVDTTTGTQTIINNGGEYKSGRGDHTHTYFFGWKTNGGINQLYRMDPDGTNEITVDVISLTGVNEKAQGLALDEDSQRLFFHDDSTDTLRSVDWDLTVGSYTTYGLTLPSNDWGDMDYSQGFLFWGGLEPTTGGYNSKFYRYEIATGDQEEIGGTTESIRGGNEGTADVFVHRARNELWISGESRVRFITPTTFDFHETFMFASNQQAGGVTISWTPVSGATSYSLLQDGVSVGTTATTSIDVTGLGISGTSYTFTLESSTDDIVFNPVIYYTVQHIAGSVFVNQEFPAPTNWPQYSTYFCVLDPYSPTEFLLSSSTNGVYKYNIPNDTIEQIAPYVVYLEDSVASCRSWSNKNVYFAPNTTGTIVYNAGVGGSKFGDYSTLAQFTADPANTAFTVSNRIRCMCSNYHNKEIYYAVDSLSEIRAINQDGTGDRTVLTTGGDVKGIAMDPFDPTSLVYTSANHIWHADLTNPGTPVITQLTSTHLHGNTHDLVINNGTIYGQHWNRAPNYGLFSVRVDGSDYFAVEHVNSTGDNIWTGARGFAFDTVAKTVVSFNLQVGVNTLFDASISELPVDPSLILVRPSPIGLDISWGPVEGATGYGFGLASGTQADGNTVVIRTSNLPPTTDRFRLNGGISPGETYTLYFYYTSTPGAAANLLVTATEITTPNTGSAADYDTSFFENENGDGGFDLSVLSSQNLGTISELLNELFDTGDSINMKLPSGRSVQTKMVRRGETAVLDEKDASMSVPFSASGGAGQSVSLTLTDTSTVVVTYDETTEEISVGGNQYSSGESFLLDGKKVTIYNI